MRRKGPSHGRNQRPAQALPTPQASNTKTPFEREQTTKRRGEISELAFALAAARQGFGISRPYGDSERYDIILDCPKNDPSHLKSVIPTEAERKRARQSVISTEAERKRAKWRDLLPAPTRPRLVRVQVKSSTQLQCGLYRVNAHRRINGRAVPYTLAEIDFFAAYVIPEDSWFIFPLTHILGATAVTLSPKRRRKRHINNPYREAWHLLYEPDGLEFA
ncbi:MAG: group I intron-associated PD-(D/E)XK endonuclease [Candidatus Sulfotelmatobacter sp.]